MKATFVIKADCTYECDGKLTGEELASYIKGMLKMTRIDGKVLIGYLKYDEGGDED